MVKYARPDGTRKVISETITALQDFIDNIGMPPGFIERAVQLIEEMDTERNREEASIETYFIWSNEHNAWWRPRSEGYCYDIKGAGLYTRQETIAICKGANRGFVLGEKPNEIPVLEIDAIETMKPENSGWFRVKS